MHDHTPSSAGGRHVGRLALVLGLVVVLLVVEVVMAISTGSLALLSDAGHLATDLVGLSLALGAILAARNRPPGGSRSFGWYRLEILAALANAVLLLGVATVVLVSAVRRIGAPVDLEPRPLLIIAIVGLAVNVFSAWLLSAGAEESLNLEGARLEVLADAIGSVGVLVTALVIQVTGNSLVDTIVALAIAGWLVPRALILGRRSLRVLLQHAPENADLGRLEAAILGTRGVTSVHDLHVWTLTSGMDVASVHVQVADPGDQHEVQHAVRDVISERTGVDHVTVQVELREDPDCCAEHPTHW